LRLSRVLFAHLVLALPATATVYQTGGLSFQQMGLTTYNVSGNTRFLDTQVRVTNNNPFTVTQAGYLTTAASLSGLPGVWNDGTHEWSAGAQTAQTIAARQLPISLTPIPPVGLGITASSSPSLRTIGDLAPGQSVVVDWFDEITDTTSTYNFSGAAVYRTDTPFYSEVSGIGVSQSGIRNVDLNVSSRLWDTTASWTNNTGRTVDLMFLLNSVLLNGSTASWNDSTRRFTAGALSAAAVNPISYLALTQTDAAPSGSGVSASSSLPAFWIGTVQPGQTVSTDLWLESGGGVGGLYFGGVLVAAEVPEPATWSLVGAAMIAAAIARRCRKAQ
jgi:hypothetical protein